jgi:hypothetical protein
MNVLVSFGTIEEECSCLIGNNWEEEEEVSTHHSVASSRMSSLNMGSNSTSAELIVNERCSCGLFGGGMLNEGCGCKLVVAAGDLSVDVEGRLF